MNNSDAKVIAWMWWLAFYFLKIVNLLFLLYSMILAILKVMPKSFMVTSVYLKHAVASL